MHLLEEGVEVGGEGIEDPGAQGLGDLADVVEQLRGGALGVVVEVEQAGVQRAQLLVGARAASLDVCSWAWACLLRGSAYVRCSGAGPSYLELVDVAQQLHVAAGDVEALQRGQHGFKARTASSLVSEAVMTSRRRSMSCWARRKAVALDSAGRGGRAGGRWHRGGRAGRRRAAA